jgi:hypothetical protein
MLRVFSIAFLIAFILYGCKVEKKDEVCHDPDAVNHGYTGTDDKVCIYSSDKIKGGWNMKVEEYPLDGDIAGNIYEMQMGIFYCTGSADTYKNISFQTNDAPMDPSTFCLILNGYDFVIDSTMNIRFREDFMTGAESFAHNTFIFDGTIHKQNGDEYPIRLSGSQWQ